MQSLEEVKNSIKDAPISAIVENFIPLRRAGSSVTGVCPFHQDTKPSLSISDEKGIFKCFACGAAGDHISFIQKYLNIDFKDALEEAAKILGIPFENTNSFQKRDPRYDMAKRLYDASSALYHQMGQSGQFEVFQKFIENRGLKESTIKKFKIGYCTGSNNFLSFLEQKKLENAGKTLKLAEEVGLLKKNQSGPQSYYDTFRDRIMFPIWDQYGQVVAYTGRATREVQKAKYMNSKDSFFFHKRQILFGLNFAKKEIRKRDQVILVEGHMDMIALDQYGFENTVAIMGTALDPAMAKHLSQMTKNVYLSLDNDNAGVMATIKVADELVKLDITPRVVNLGEAKDPDELLNSQGAAGFQRCLDESQNYFDWQIKRITKDRPEDLESKLELLPRVFQILRPLGDTLAATERIHTLLDELKIKTDAKVVVAQYRATLKGQKSSTPLKIAPAPRPERPSGEGLPKALPVSRAEQHFLKHIVLHPECMESENLTSILDFVKDIRIRKAHQVLHDIFFEVDEKDFWNTLQSILLGPTFAAEVKEIVAGALFQRSPSLRLDEKGKENLLTDLKKGLQRQNLREQETELKTKIEQTVDPLEQNVIIKELMSIRKEISKLNT